jgi:hypothetical protein
LREERTMRRWLPDRRLAKLVVAAGLVGGMALGAAGGRVERDGTASVVAVLVLIVAGIQLLHIWRT